MLDLRQIAVAAAVAILSAVFVILLMDLVYPEPKYFDYCKEEFRKPIPTTPIAYPEAPCYDYSSEGYLKCAEDGGIVRWKQNETGCYVYHYCDFCNKDYDNARKIHSRNVFVVAGLIGTIAIFTGTMWKIEFLASGLMFGGIILLFYATARFFGDADKLMRVIIIFIELLLVLWIGYKKLYKSEEKKKRKKK